MTTPTETANKAIALYLKRHYAHYLADWFDGGFTPKELRQLGTILYSADTLQKGVIKLMQADDELDQSHALARAGMKLLLATADWETLQQQLGHYHGIFCLLAEYLIEAHAEYDRLFDGIDIQNGKLPEYQTWEQDWLQKGKAATGRITRMAQRESQKSA